MWTVIKRTPQFIASDLYVTIETIGFHASVSSQHGSGVEAPHLWPLGVQPSFADATPLPYNNQPCSAVDDVDETEVLGTTHTHDVGGSSHMYEHVQADMDGGIDIDASRDVYEEFIDTDGLVDDAEVLDVPLIENNEKDCPTTVPIPEWFTSNTWDNIKDPSPTLGTGHLISRHKGDHPAIGMLFKSKASVQYVLTLYSVEHNKQYKFEANKEKAKLYIVRWMSMQQQLYTVETQSSLLNTSGGDHTHRVSLMDMTCTCGKWEANKIPYSHLIAVCAKHNHDATEYMDRFYLVEEWYHSYEPIFQPLKDRLEWLEPEERRTVMPKPWLIREKGWPTSTRICNEMDDEGRELPTSLWIENGPKLKCGLCRQEGHNRCTCPTRNVASTSRGATKEAVLQQREVCSSNTVAMSCVPKVPEFLRTVDEVWIPTKFISKYGVDLSNTAFLRIPNEIDYTLDDQAQVCRMEDNESDDDSVEIMDGFTKGEGSEPAAVKSSIAVTASGRNRQFPAQILRRVNIRSAQKKVVNPSAGPSKTPRVRSTTGDVPDEAMHGDPTAAVAEDGDDAYGQLLHGLLVEVAALRADIADYRRPVPPSPPFDSS
nr:hypothetical protein CFP56_35165 [Quercus suber]